MKSLSIFILLTFGFICGTIYGTYTTGNRFSKHMYVDVDVCVKPESTIPLLAVR